MRVYVGNSFDLTGERVRKTFKVDAANHKVDETFEITLKNHKKDEAVEIRAVEHLSRYDNWKINDEETTDKFTQLDSHTIEFRSTLKPDEVKVITYTVHYSW